MVLSQGGRMRTKTNLGFALVVAMAVTFFASTGQAPAYSISGDVTAPGDYSTTGLLWNVVNGGSATNGATINSGVGNPLNPTGENWIEGDYVLVKGGGGSSAVFSVGEINPGYGKESVNLVSNGSGGYNLASFDTRDVTDVSGIQVIHAVDVIKGGTYSYSTSLTLSGSGIPSVAYTLPDLQGMTQTTYTGGKIYTGPTLLSVFNNLGINTGDLNKVIIVRGSDGYATVLSMGEVVGATSPVLLAISASDGSLNGGGASDKGLARLAITGDSKAGLWVSNLASIEVDTIPTPEPATILLFGCGLLGLCGLKLREKMMG
jgi:hypothetical protein